VPIAAADKGHCRATYGTTAYGWAKYHCHFTADFGPSDKGLAAKAAHNTDSEVDDDTASTLFMTGSGATLKLAEDIPHSARDANLPAHLPARRRFRRSAVSHQHRGD